MLQIFSLLGLGFVLGLKHALDADHIAAMSVFVSHTKSAKKAMMRGLYWGLGHTAVLLFVAVLSLILKLQIDPQLEHYFELAVGAMLIFIGGKSLIEMATKNPHSHFPFGLHSHPKFTVLTGAVHGLAGSAALILILAASAKSTLVALMYVGIFGIGSIMGMVFFALALSAWAARMGKYLTATAGVISVVVGLHIFIS